MHPKLKHILLIFIQTTLLSISSSQKDNEYATCSKSFQCGKLSNLSYPFWGGARPLSCGYPGFQLNCGGDVPLLNISSLSYRLLNVDLSTYTLRVAREDLWNNTCPTFLHKTTLDPVYFDLSPDSSDREVTLYYGCGANRLLNQFSCDVDGVTTVNVFDVSSRGLGSNIKCTGNITVPVNRTAAAALETPTDSSVRVLQDALASGFSVRWSADNQNCSSCRQSNGTCGYTQDTGRSVSSTGKEGTTIRFAVPLPPPPPPPPPPPGVPPPQSVPNAPGPERGGNRSSPSYPGGISPRLWIIIVLYIKRRRSMEGHNLVSNKGIEKFLQQHGYLSLKRFKHSEIKKITKSFTDKLGQGGYGTVYRGMLHDGCPVAVKILTETNSNGEEFVNEVVSISRTSHVNIVNLLGFCYDGNKRALVYEFMPNKSLDKFISSSGAECNLDLNTLYKIAVGVANGLEYLHTGCSTRIVHFDIKPQNILLDEDLCPKISDFGLAKLCRKTQSAVSLLGTIGTVGYIAPEIFSRNYGRVSLKSDVYSYGMMVLEMIGANKIVQSGGSQSSENYFPDRIYELATVDVTQNPDDLTVGEEEETARKLILVGFWCIQTTPSERPLMSKVVEMLEGSLESIQIPPKPVLFTPSLPQQDLSSSLSAYIETESSVEAITNG
ncbi:hypothetical protein ACS0TY_008592 [Phlomoides rotata]